MNGHVLLYADRVTPNMQKAIDETARRREVQQAYNAEHGITPMTIRRAIDSPLASLIGGDFVEVELERPKARSGDAPLPEDPRKIPNLILKLRKEMKKAAGKMEFERAAELRDRIKMLEGVLLEGGLPS